MCIAFLLICQHPSKNLYLVWTHNSSFKKEFSSDNAKNMQKGICVAWLLANSRKRVCLSCVLVFAVIEEHAGWVAGRCTERHV